MSSTPLPSSGTTRISWEYLHMPKRIERAAGYIRESDPGLAGSATEESQARVVRVHAQKEGYDYSETHEYKEAISAYLVPYTQRSKLLELLAAAKRGEFTVLIVSEIRALSRKQVEIFVLYDMLQKYGVRLETVQEKFEDSAMGRFILATRAMVAEIERENTYMRTQRGKKDRIENGNLTGQGKAAYGYQFEDTKDETNARYVLNTTVVYSDDEGTEWTEVQVILFMVKLALEGTSLRKIAVILTQIGIPIPYHGKLRKGKPITGYWTHSTVHHILTDPMYTGQASARRYYREGTKQIRRLEGEVRLPDGVVPPIIDKDTFAAIQRQLTINKQDALRNNNHPKDLGILRCGYCFCGICNGTMHVKHHNPSGKYARNPEYTCQVRTGRLEENHITTIVVDILDRAVWEKAVEVILHPKLIRERLEGLRKLTRKQNDTVSIENTLTTIRRQMQNIYKLAQSATDDETIDTLAGMMKDLEKQKHATESLMYDMEEEEEAQQKIEEEIAKFEAWAAKVQPFLGDPSYEASYEEKRLAVHILGINATVFPASGGHPFRFQIDIAPPSIVDIVSKQSE